jgi:hypothetical protein
VCPSKLKTSYSTSIENNKEITNVLGVERRRIFRRIFQTRPNPKTRKRGAKARISHQSRNEIIR